MKIPEHIKAAIRAKFKEKLDQIENLKAEIEELKRDAYRYKFVRSTCATAPEQIAGYDKSVDEHIRRRNEKLN
jgi:hypothetical protein